MSVAHNENRKNSKVINKDIVYDIKDFQVKKSGCGETFVINFNDDDPSKKIAFLFEYKSKMTDFEVIIAHCGLSRNRSSDLKYTNNAHVSKGL